MAIVAVIAALIGLDTELLGFVLIAAPVALALAFVVLTLGDLLHRARNLMMALLSGVLALLVLGEMGRPVDAVDLAITAATVVLTIGNLAGPVVLAGRLRLRQPLFSGHWLWAGVALLWPVPAFLIHPHRRVWTLILLADAARLLLAIAVLTLAFASRATSGVEGARSDRVGWLVAEADVLLWGLMAADLVGWI